MGWNHRCTFSGVYLADRKPAWLRWNEAAQAFNITREDNEGDYRHTIDVTDLAVLDLIQKAREAVGLENATSMATTGQKLPGGRYAAWFLHMQKNVPRVPAAAVSASLSPHMNQRTRPGTNYSCDKASI